VIFLNHNPSLYARYNNGENILGNPRMDKKTNEIYMTLGKDFWSFYILAHIGISSDYVELDMVCTLLESLFYIFLPGVRICDILHFPDYPERISKTKER